MNIKSSIVLLFLLLSSVSGKIGYLGFSVHKDDGHFIIKTITAGSEAEKNGLHIGDQLVKINQTNLAGLSESEVKTLLKGELKSTIELSVKVPGEDSVAVLTLVYQKPVVISPNKKNRATYEEVDFEDDSHQSGARFNLGVGFRIVDGVVASSGASNPLFISAGIFYLSESFWYGDITGKAGLGGHAESGSSNNSPYDNQQKATQMFSFASYDINAGVKYNANQKITLFAGSGLSWIGYELTGTDYDDHGTTFGYNFTFGFHYFLSKRIISGELNLYNTDLEFKTTKSQSLYPGITARYSF
ncbi:MAG: PDZ domain-containing protein [Fibrobacterales bacterium]